MSRSALAGVVALALAAGFGVVWFVRGRAPAGPAAPEAPAAPLYRAQDAPMSVRAYFAAADGMLEPEERTIYRSVERVNQMKQALLELVKGPADPAHVAVLPAGSALREIYVDGQGVAYVDLAGRATEATGLTGEWLRVQALVATLLENFEDLKSVHVLVDGAPRETLAGHVDLSRPFVTDPSLLRAAAATP